MPEFTAVPVPPVTLSRTRERRAGAEGLAHLWRWDRKARFGLGCVLEPDFAIYTAGGPS
jgi:hypothetical protein